MIAPLPAAGTERTGTTNSFTSTPTELRPLSLLAAPGLADPIFVQVEYADDQVIISDVATGIFGVASSASEAVTDFLAALHEHADVLAAQGALSPDLQRQLEYLHRHLG